jgi:hypothetical protein
MDAGRAWEGMIFGVFTFLFYWEWRLGGRVDVGGILSLTKRLNSSSILHLFFSIFDFIRILTKYFKSKLKLKDSRAHAESAKEALDGKSIKGRQIRVRFAVHGATIKVANFILYNKNRHFKVKELSPAVSNEMLHLTFSAFGEVERAIHIVDEKGRPTGEGIIEFEKKNSAQEALAQIKERVFLMTA